MRSLLAFIDAAVLFTVLSNLTIIGLAQENAPTWAALGVASLAFRLALKEDG